MTELLLWNYRIADTTTLRNLVTLILTLTILLPFLISAAKKVRNWLHAWRCLRHLRGPCERMPWLFLFQMRKALNSQDPRLESGAKLFNYFEGIFQVYQKEPLIKVYFGIQPFLVIYTPEITEKILSSTENANKSLLYRMMKAWIGNGLLTSEKEVWKPRRKVLTPAFHFRILEDYIPVMTEKGSILVEKLEKLRRQQEWVDVLPVLRLCAFSILFETAMGLELDEGDVEKRGFMKANDAIANAIMKRMTRVWMWPDLPYGITREGKDFHEMIKIVKEYTLKVIRIRKSQYLSLNNRGQGEKKRRQNFMDILLKYHFEEKLFTEEDIREEVNTFMIGGFDTTATAAAFTIYLLGLHPEVQMKVHEEMDSIFKGDQYRPVTLEDIKQMRYLDCVLKESLRLFPPIPVIARKIGEDLTADGYVIPKGSIGLIFIYFLHHNPAIYPEPEKFNPDRFLGQAAQRHPFAYIPFAGGFRNCIGQRFATLEDKILLSHIMRRYSITSKTSREDLQLSLELVLRPSNGLEVKLTPRNVQQT